MIEAFFMTKSTLVAVLAQVCRFDVIELSLEMDKINSRGTGLYRQTVNT